MMVGDHLSSFDTSQLVRDTSGMENKNCEARDHLLLILREKGDRLGGVRIARLSLLINPNIPQSSRPREVAS
jgi:hypothetical protein